MKRAILWIVALVVVIVVIVAIANDSRQQAAVQTGPIKIGFIGPLSGDAAAYGATEKNATEMALAKIHQMPEYSGMQVDIVYEDGKCNGKDAASAAQKLISIDQVQVILGGVCSAETLGAAPVAEASKVLLFSAFSSAPAITNAGDYVFRNSVSDNDSGTIDADMLASKYKKVAIISEATDYSAGVRQVILDSLAKKGVQVVDDESYQGGTKDFRTILSKVKAANPDAVYFNPGTSPQAAGLLIKQARDLGITAPAYFNFFMGNKDTEAIAGKSAEGVVFSDFAGIASSSKWLISDYKNAYGSDPANESELGSAYDRVFIVLQAIKAVGYDATKIKDYLYAMTDYPGTIGTYRFDKNGDMVGTGFSHFIIKDGVKTSYNQ